MTIDHAGVIIFPEYTILRIIGRLSFPLFSYLIILGLETTQNVRKYFIRLFIFALLSQVPYYFAFGFEPVEQLNIFFTLSFSVLFMVLYRKNNVLMLLPILISFILNFEGSYFGIALIWCIDFLRKNIKLGIPAFLILNFVFFSGWSIQIFSFLAVPIILLHHKGILLIEKEINEKKIFYSIRKYFFYFYYPLHLSIFYLIKTFYL